MTYNRFIQGLKAAGVEVDRRMLAELAVNDQATFATLVKGRQGRAPLGRERAEDFSGLSRFPLGGMLCERGPKTQKGLRPRFVLCASARRMRAARRRSWVVFRYGPSPTPHRPRRHPPRSPSDQGGRRSSRSAPGGRRPGRFLVEGPQALREALVRQGEVRAAPATLPGQEDAPRLTPAGRDPGRVGHGRGRGPQ